MSSQEIAAVTGLPIEQARLASKREFDEPVTLNNAVAEGELFCRQASGLGLDCVRGNRFIHLFSGSDKGRAVKIFTNLYRQLKGAVFSIALGDSPNDIPMLKASDKAIILNNKNAETGIKDFFHPDLVKIDDGGPIAWNKIMLSILSDNFPENPL